MDRGHPAAGDTDHGHAELPFRLAPKVPLWLALIGPALTVAGWALGTWAMAANRFFSAVVRIQTDRGYTVGDSGPYRWMRHPAYTGGVVSDLVVPLLLGSAWVRWPAPLSPRPNN